MVARAIFYKIKGKLIMKTYEEIYSTLLKLCKNENLRLVEAELEDEEIVMLVFDDRIVLNTGCEKYSNNNFNFVR